MDWKLIEDKSWSSLEQQFGWVREMNTVTQDICYHAEGNVAVHTRMVLEALQQSAAYQSLSALEKEIVWAAALLHDVEKRSTSVDEGEGRVSAKGHARKGEYTARTILYRDCPVPFRIREQIASLVRYHGVPIWIMEKPDSVKKLCEVSLRVDTSLLKILSEADVRGRICDDKKELLEAVELFEIFCREQDCWNKPREFATDYARFHYFHTEGGYIDYIPHEQFKCEVTMLSGLSPVTDSGFINQPYACSRHCAHTFTKTAVRYKHEKRYVLRTDTQKKQQRHHLLSGKRHSCLCRRCPQDYTYGGNLRYQ